MRKAFRFRLSPTKKQAEKLFWTLNRCRELYIAALSERKDAYRIAGKSISYYEQKRDLPEIKEIRPEYTEIPTLPGIFFSSMPGQEVSHR